MALIRPRARWLTAWLCMLLAGYCAAIILIWIHAGVSPADLLADTSPLYASGIYLLVCILVGLGVASVLLSRQEISQPARLAILAGLALTSLPSAWLMQLVVPLWLLPLWYAWSFYRDADA
ncbi:MAG TPA: hypothetical protein VN084_07385 [Methylophilaceae bacterium]|nr:hypothetical protein [Methylophilaceae bacterium]